MMQSRKLFGLALLAGSCICTPQVHARVLRVDVEAIKPANALPNAPAYEIVSGTFSGEVDPHDARNAIITDIGFAPTNDRGMVEYRATYRIARPINPQLASGVLVYDVPNRGNGGVGADVDGNIRVISGWQGDISSNSAQRAWVPVARHANGSPVTGPVLTRFVKLSASQSDVFIGGGMGNATPRPDPVSLDTRKARLWINRAGETPRLVSAKDWAFGDCRTSAFPGKPDGHRLCLKDHFEPEAGYTLVYQGKDPLVLGLGFAATRDFVAFLRSGKADDAGNANPAGGSVKSTVGVGHSQSGNFLRSFVNLGFNADESGARVFDGINPDIAARQVPLNLRFGVPGGAAETYQPGSEGTLWWNSHEDSLRKLGTTSLLDRCKQTATCPKIIETFGSAEYWGLRFSPDQVGLEARADIPLPDNLRRYYFPSVTHSGGRGTGFSTKGEGSFGDCVLPGNPNPSADSWRVAVKMLIDWVVKDKQPLPSRYPTLAGHDLVPPIGQAMGWPRIPGTPVPDGHINPMIEQKFGPAFKARDLSGALNLQPPVIGRTFPSLVPGVNSDGNETAGVPSVQLQVPLGTYTGWNIEAKGVDKGKNCGFNGGFIPFARTLAERTANGDPRPSLEERYTDHADFVARIKDAVTRQMADGWLLADDAERIIRDAEASTVLK